MNFVRQFDEVGLKDVSQLTGIGSSFINIALPAMGEAAVGAVSSLNYGPEELLPANVAFRDAYAAAFNRPTGPSFYAMMAFDFGNTIKGVLGGDLSDTTAVVKSVGNLDIDSSRGPLRYSLQTHDPIQNLYIRRTVAIPGGAPQNVVVDVLPNVEVPQEEAAGNICDLSA